MQTKVVELDLNDVLPNRFQPRIKFSEESIQDLAESIKEHGVIQPIVVRNIGDKYEIIAGERRYKASILAGKQTIPAIITDLSEKDSAEVALIENVQRKDLTPIEEAISYKKILDMGYLTQDSLALKLGKTQSTIANKLRLLNLDDDVQEALLNEKISERHARSLLKLNSHEKQRKLLERIISERLTVRKTDEEIDKMINDDVNTEILSFGEIIKPIEPIQEINNDSSENIETLEYFNPTLESLNIPTEPIALDSIPEVLPNIPERPTTSYFNPGPEVINSTVPPIVFDTLEDEESEEEMTINPVSSGNNVVEPAVNIFNPIPNIDESSMTDIFVEKPLAPMDNLLQASPVFEKAIESEQPTYNEPEEKAEDILVPGKFFNLMPEDEEEVKVENATEMNNFNFDFDVNSLNNVESTNSLTSLGTFPNLENNNSEPTIESLFDFNTVKDNDSILNLEREPVDKIFEQIPSLESVTIPELSSSYDAQPSVVPAESFKNVNNSRDVKDAINMVRELSENLSKMGFVLDVEEFDFENMYQVVFKINK